ncbi:MAG: DUF373 family protein [Candidatus Aenigmatarchaeota archaeon]
MVEKLILCIDRDNDVGEKTGIRGPIIGLKENIAAANALILADPSDTDSNTIFAAIKLKKEMRDAEVVTLTGNKRVGIKSDEEISKQLDVVIKKTKATKTVLVTDGLEDEFVLPLIQSRLQIISMHRVIVQQSERLEGAYFMIKKFVNDTVDDPRMAKLVLGIPAMAFILIALFGAEGWRIVLGALGLFLFVKGFKLEKIVESVYSELKTSLENDRISFFMYALSVVLVFVGIGFGYNNMIILGTADIVQSTLSFLYGSIYIFFAAGFVVWFGKVLLSYTQGNLKTRYITILALLFAITIVGHSAINILLQPQIGLEPLLISVAIGLITLGVALVVEKATKPPKSAQESSSIVG